MGIRTRGLDIKLGANATPSDQTARAEAKALIDRWNEQLASGRDMLWSPTIRAALIAGMPWLDVFLSGIAIPAKSAMILRSASRPISNQRATTNIV
jgi:hypothetical protein